MFSILYLMCLLAAIPQPASNAPRRQESCLERRTACMNSCAKQRESCDRENPTDAARCVEQQKSCESDCDVVWKRCYEDMERRAQGK